MEIGRLSLFCILTAWGSGEFYCIYEGGFQFLSITSIFPIFSWTLEGLFRTFRLLYGDVRYGNELDCNFCLGDVLSIMIIASCRQT